MRAVPGFLYPVDPLLYPVIVKVTIALRAAVPLLLASLDTSAYVTNYLPLTVEQISHRFPQQAIRMELLPHSGAAESVRIGTSTVRFSAQNKIEFAGVDIAGKPWMVTADSGMGGALYSADLDHNGIADIIYACYTGGNGWAPQMHLLTVLFDKDGRPVPSEMDGYFEIDRRGVKDLLDLDGDGHAELIRQAYDDGYWITSAYEARDAHWHRIGGLHASVTFPIYTRFTNRANRIPTTPAVGRHPVEDDLSNDQTAYSGALVAVHWANVSQSENPELDLSDGTVCIPVAWQSTMVVVKDSANGRSAATLGAAEEAYGLLNEIMRAKVGVEVKGHRRYAVTGEGKSKPTGCVPETIWASLP